MHTLIIAATRSQKEYFSQLKTQLEGKVDLVWYKDLSIKLPLSLRHSQSLTPSIQSSIEGIVNQKLHEKTQKYIHQKDQHTDQLPLLKKHSLHLIRQIKHWEAKQLFLRYRQCIQSLEPQLIIIWNGLKFRQRLFVLAAQSLNVSHTLFFENGLLPNTTTIDFKGVNYLNTVPRKSAFFQEYLRSQGLTTEIATQQLHKSLTPFWNIEERPTQLPQKYIFIPFQVNSDSQITLFSPWIPHMRVLFDVIKNAAEHIDTENLHFIFKLHPADNEEYTDLKAELPKNFHFIENIPTSTLIQHAHAVITINSTVGLESLIFNKKVIVLGQAFYNMKHLTLQASNSKSLAAKIDQVNDWIYNEPLRIAFLHYLFNQYAVPCDWKNPSDQHWQHIRARIQRQLWLSTHEGTRRHKMTDILEHTNA